MDCGLIKLYRIPAVIRWTIAVEKKNNRFVELSYEIIW